MELTSYGGTFATKGWLLLVFSFMLCGSERNVNVSDRRNSKHLKCYWNEQTKEILRHKLLMLENSFLLL